jgi:hypothetical protein
MVKINLEASKFLVVNKATDFRKELDGLCALVTSDLRRRYLGAIGIHSGPSQSN